jgi:hypothetical protein
MSVFQHGNTWLSAARQRARQGIMQAIGGQTSSDDQEYDEKYKNFNTHVQELAKMKELMEIWVDAFDSFCKATTLVSEAWRQYHSSNPYLDEEDIEGNIVDQTKYPFSPVAAELDNIALNMDERVRPAIVSTFQARCIKPVSSILSLVPQLQEHHLARKLVLSEFDSYRLKMEKEFAVGRDSTHPNVMRKAAKLDESAKKLHTEQSLLFQRFHEFETARSQTLGPELGVFISCLYSFSSMIHSEMSEVLPLIPQSATTLAILDHAKLNPAISNSSQRFTKLTASFDTNYKQSRPVDVIVTRPVAAGGAVGGYGTVTVADFHSATIEAHFRKQTDEDEPFIASVPCPEPSGATSILEPASTVELSRPVSELSMASNSQSFQIPLPQILSSSMQTHGQTYFCHVEDDELASRPISDITLGTVLTVASENLGSDTTQPPPKPPRKVRPASASVGHSAVDHMESVREADENASMESNCGSLMDEASPPVGGDTSSSIARNMLTATLSLKEAGIIGGTNRENPTDSMVEYPPSSAADCVTYDA